MHPQTITVLVADGWEIIECDTIEPTGQTVTEIIHRPSMKLRRVHEWPEWLLKFARLNQTKWLTINAYDLANLSEKEPEALTNTWFTTGTMIHIPNDWAPQNAPARWQDRKWRLPL